MYNATIGALLDKQLEIARLQPGAFTRARAGAGKTLILLEFLLGHLPGQRTLYFVNSAALCHNTKKSLPENFPQEGVEIARSEEIDRILCRQLPALILPEGVRLSNYDDFLRWAEQEELLQPPREASPKVKRATKIDFACLWAEFTHQIIRPNLADPKRQSPFLSRQEFEGQRDDESHTLKKDRPEIYTLFERYIQWLTENNLIESHIRKHALYLAVTAEKENDKDDVLLNLLFDRVASDEVQLQHDWDWYLSLSLLKNPHENWRMACDWNQCGRELRLKSSSRFRAACEYFGIENLHEFALNTNRRAGKKLVVLQDRLETLLENFWPSKGGEARPTEETSETPEETAAKNNDHSSIAHFTYDEFSKKNKPEGAVILVPSSVSDEKMQAIKSEFGQLFSLDKPYAEVYRANQVTGMEWRDVVLLGFDEALSAELDELNRYRNPETQDTENPIDRFVKIRGRRDADKITPPSQSAHYALVDLYMLTGRPTHSLTFISKKKHPFIDTIIEGLLQTPAEAQQAEIESAVVVMTKK
ncbi:MAG: hypothetical protein NTU49_06605, partial [Gammaproteobacteria bacterium]|nr:hypothetical protein [Gammaproteobacteria bacterium]